MVCLVEDHSRNISGKFLSKYRQWNSCKMQIFIFSILSHWQLLLSCHSNQSSYQNGTKHILFVPLPIDAICEVW